MSSDVINEFMKEAKLLFSDYPGELTDDLRLREDLNATSMQYMGMAATIEDLTDEPVTYGQLRACGTIGGIVELIQKIS